MDVDVQMVGVFEEKVLILLHLEEEVVTIPALRGGVTIPLHLEQE